MSAFTNPSALDMPDTLLEQEWMITIDTPDGGLPKLLEALETNLPLRQGPYDCCSFVRAGGQQRFRCLEGSHAGSEGAIRQTPASQVVVSIPQDDALIRKVFDTIFESHVNEEPTVRVQAVWGSRSKLRDDKENPNRYWNRTDSDILHGTSSEKSL